MSSLRSFLHRLRALTRSDEIHRDIAEEMEFHIGERTAENLRRGMSKEVARCEAERRFGHLAQLREQGYDARGPGWLEILWQDLRFGLRMLRRSAGSSLLAILCLTLGIAANAAVFSWIEGILL